MPIDYSSENYEMVGKTRHAIYILGDDHIYSMQFSLYICNMGVVSLCCQFTSLVNPAK